MAAFDIITASAQAYKNTWAIRSYILKLAIVPFVLRLFCFTMAITYASGNFTYFMLIMLPALFAQGWMLAHLVRFQVLGQTWPFRPTGDMESDLAVIGMRARGVLGGMIVFVLINMTVGVLSELIRLYMLPYVPVEGAEQMEVPVAVLITSILLLGFMIWGFRLLWLYIPYALNMGGMTYLRALKGIQVSFSMFIVWVICGLPFVAMVALAGGLIGDPLAATFGKSAGNFVMILFTVAGDLGKSIMATAGITYALSEVFTKQNKVRL